jgi:hypothetical protein
MQSMRIRNPASGDTLLVFAGWKTRTVEGRMRKKFFLAPDGSSFACRRSGLQHMLREGFPAPAIAEMKAKLSHEGLCYFCTLLCGFGSGTGLKADSACRRSISALKSNK